MSFLIRKRWSIHLYNNTENAIFQKFTSALLPEKHKVNFIPLYGYWICVWKKYIHIYKENTYLREQLMLLFVINIFVDIFTFHIGSIVISNANITFPIYCFYLRHARWRGSPNKQTKNIYERFTDSKRGITFYSVHLYENIYRFSLKYSKELRAIAFPPRQSFAGVALHKIEWCCN